MWLWFGQITWIEEQKKQNQQEKRAISSEFHFGAEILTKQL